jgi:ketosteroid isomerase-like protein
MNKLLTGLFAGLISISISISAMSAHHGSTEAEVQAAIDAFGEAYKTNDVEGYFSYYADDANVFFYGQRQDMSAYHEEWVTLMKEGGGVVVNDESDGVIQMLPGGDAAVASYFIHNETRYPETGLVSEDAFETEIWQKIDGEWKIVNLHYSVIVPEE